MEEIKLRKNSFSFYIHPPTQWHPLLTSLRDRLSGEHPDLRFNSVLSNLYRDGHCGVAWHADDEPSLGECPPIASVSLGDTRAFELRENPSAEEVSLTLLAELKAKI